MVSGPAHHDSVHAVLQTIDDPEMPISIVDLGIVEAVAIDDAHATITVLPTFVGCPALSMIEDEIRRAVSALDGIEAVTVRFVHAPPWSVDRITDAGRAQLKAHGVTVPERGGLCGADHDRGPSDPIPLRTSAIPCPFCGSTETRMESPFGPARCRQIYYCDGCRNTFEHLKRV